MDLGLLRGDLLVVLRQFETGPKTFAGACLSARSLLSCSVLDALYSTILYLMTFMFMLMTVFVIMILYTTYLR